MKKCTRCGVCCSTKTCEYAKENADQLDICDYLVHIDNGVYSCELVDNGTIRYECVEIGKGCALQDTPILYEFYSRQTEFKRLLNEENSNKEVKQYED
jgi:hypothetical protein